MTPPLNRDLMENVAFPVELRRGHDHYLAYVTPFDVDFLVAHHVARRRPGRLWLTGSGDKYRYFNYQEDEIALAVSDFEYRFLVQVRERRAVSRISPVPPGVLIRYEVTDSIVEVTRSDGLFELAYLAFFDKENVYGSRTAKEVGVTQRIYATHGSYFRGGLHIQDLYDSRNFDASRIQMLGTPRSLRMMASQKSFRPLGGLEDDLRESYKRILRIIGGNAESRQED